MNGRLLAVVDLGRSFGGIAALQGVSLSIARNEIHAVVGPNGAGKTTLFNIITGLLPADSGSIVLADRDITGASVRSRVRLGLGRSFQRSNLFPSLTVEDNLRAGLLAAGMFRGGRGAQLEAPLERLLSDFGLSEVTHTPAGELSHGYQRKVDLALAMAEDPQVVLLDEPTSGMGREDVSGIVRLLEAIRQRGCAVLLIEHNIPVVLELADRLTVLHRGTVVSTGLPKVVAQEPEVRQVYLGMDE